MRRTEEAVDKMSQTLFLAPSASQVKEVVRLIHLEAGSEGRMVVATAEPEVMEAVRHAGLQPTQLDSYPGAGQAWSEAASWSHDWYRDAGRDLSMFDGLSAGGIIEVDMFVFFSRLLEDVDQLQRVLSVENPERVWLGADARPSWARLLPIVQPDLSIRLLGGSMGSAAKSAVRPHTLKDWLKQAALDRQSRAFLLALRRPRSPAPAAGPVSVGRDGNILVVADIPTPSVLGSLLPVIEALPREVTYVMATDPRVLSQLKGVSSRIVSASMADLVSAWRVHRRAASTFRDRWVKFEAIVKDGAKRFQYQDVDLWPILAPRLRRAFVRQFPFSVLEASVAANLLRRYRIKVIVTASHSHYAGRLYCDVGATLSIPSLSLQHGVAGVPSIYTPVHSTKMAVWGELPRRWLVENGANPDQLVVTGQPRLDALISPGPPLSKLQVLARLGLDPNRPVWIVAPDPEPRDVRHAMTEMIVSIVSAFPDIQLIVRPHPDDDAGYYAARLAGWIDKRRIALGIDFDAASLLGACELVFIGQSTLGLEAMILARPVVVLNLARSDEFFVPYVREGAAAVVYDAAELIPVVTRLLGTDRARFDAGRRRFVERYASAADGRSTGRVVDLIGRMARGTT